jgi:hypothetical protein
LPFRQESSPARHRPVTVVVMTRTANDVFTHELEAEVCRRVLGDRAHGLDT